MQSGALPLPSLACATASITAAPLIKARRDQMEIARGIAVDHVKAKGFRVVPTSANMFMIDWKTKPAKDMQAAFRKESVEIGRSWPIWPTVSRVTVGSQLEMKAFCMALDKVIA
jgi:histidinol-phosphate aminotransferase